MSLHSFIATRRRQRGLSLIEIMVAVVVLSVGLLGMAALMGVSVRNTQSANFRTQATNLAYDAIDMMRGNMSNLGYYEMAAASDPAVVCEDPQEPIDLAGCGTVASCDIARWTQELCYTLPLGRGQIDVDITRVGADTLEAAATVTINWCDDRSLVDDAGDCAAGETQFVVEAGL